MAEGSRSGRCRPGRHDSVHRPRPRRGAASGRDSAVPTLHRTPTRRTRKRNPRARIGLALCDENRLRQEAAHLQLHGLQSRPERTKYRCAARACWCALSPCPNRRRSDDPIWKRPRYWPFCARVERWDSHRATETACRQYLPNTPQMAARGGARREAASLPPGVAEANESPVVGDLLRRSRQAPGRPAQRRERDLRVVGGADERPVRLEEADRAAVLARRRDLQIEPLLERKRYVRPSQLEARWPSASRSLPQRSVS